MYTEFICQQSDINVGAKCVLNRAVS